MKDYHVEILDARIDRKVELPRSIGISERLIINKNIFVPSLKY